MQTTIHWFRNDLRLADNPALMHAVEQGAVIPVFIWSPDDHGKWSPGGASQWWLHQSLTSLSASLEKIGSRLILQQGDPLEILKDLAETATAESVVWNRRYEPALIAADKRVKQGLAEVNIDVQSFNGALLYEPWDIETKQGKPYQVFTPMYRTTQAMPEPSKPVAAPKKMQSPTKWPNSEKLDALGLMPKIKWYGGMADTWDVSERGAMKRLKAFAGDPIGDYNHERDIPSHQGTSKLSPYLHHGEISPRQAYHAALKCTRGNAGNKLKENAHHYIRELVWREFGYHLIYHFPQTSDKPLREKYEKFPWANHNKGTGRAALAAWQRGQTGYPIVDAGMRQLWHTGWMHNRVRMVVASFLVKHLLIDWRQGAKWFWDTLVDADLASNTLGWQWAGGCGADAAPYFRIFNPMTQGEKFDAEGEYVKKWCPELQDIPMKYIHKPWDCPPLELQAAGVTLGEHYPEPIVDHRNARARALNALAKITGD